MKLQCRKECGACCIAPSISSTMPLHPNGKAAGESCLHLDEHYRCSLFDSIERPRVCSQLKPSLEMCGNNREEALNNLTQLEQATNPLDLT